MEQHQQTTPADRTAAPDSAHAADGAPDQGSAAGTGHSASSPAAPPPALENLLRGLLRDLKGGARGAIFLPPLPDRLEAGAGALVVLALADFLLNLFVSLFLVGKGGYFASQSVTTFYFHLPLFLLMGLVAATLEARPRLTAGTAAALVALSIPIELAHAVLEWLSQLRRFDWLQDYLAAPHYYRFFWWWAAAAFVLLSRLATGIWERRVVLPILLLVLVLPPLWYFPRGDLWVGSGTGSESGELRLTDEVLSAQDRLLDEELSSILPGRPGVTDLYFVGFAGDGTQDVFLKELTFAQVLFDQRFGTAGRSVLLANNPQTAATLPFASADNLGRVLTRLGEVMNQDEDVLFLYLTSHGTREHELEVNHPPLDLKAVTPERLRRELKKSGIRWKVVVVSACFAGGFIDPLKEEGTMVITAADATHESFGCGFGEEFTWFGQAFLADGLTRTRSFRDGFERARATVGKWEEERGETPSNPQLWAGDAIWPRLETLERQLKGGTREK